MGTAEGGQPERSIEVTGRSVNVVAPTTQQWSRGPGDVIRVAVAAASVLVALFLFTFAENSFIGVQTDVNEAIRQVPEFLVYLSYMVFGTIAAIIPAVLFFWLLIKRRWRLFGIYLVTTFTATGIFGLLSSTIADRVPDLPSPRQNIPDWVDLGNWDPGAMASLAAVIVVSGPWLSRRWRRTSWALLLMVIPLQLLIGLEVPSGLVVGLAGGWLIGSLAVLGFGSPQRNPSAETVVHELDDAGVHLASLERAGVDARGSTPYFGCDVGGTDYFVKVLGADERDADLMFRVYRWFRLSNVGDERPFLSLKRAVEHEALVSVIAERSGVRTPKFEAVVEFVDGSMALVYDRVAGRSFDQVEPSEITDDVLQGVWREVALLHSNGVAHRDLRVANVFLDGDRVPMLIDFGFGEVSASEALLQQDVAQLVVSSSFDVGPARAVADAIAVIGSEAVAEASPRMQSLALAGATQSALRIEKKMLSAVHDEVVAQTGIDKVELAKVERVRPRTIVMTALLFLAVWFLIPQFAQLPRILQQLRGADWAWAVPAFALSMLTYVGAAMALSSSVTQRLSIVKTTLATLGGSFVNRVSPAKVAGMALNVRYMQKQGVPTSVAAASVGLSQLVGLAVHLFLLVLFGVWAGRSVSLTEFLPSGTIVFVVVAVVMVAVGVFLAVPKLRAVFRKTVRPQMGAIAQNMKDLAQHPLNLGVMVLGSTILTLSYIGALWASIQAFGGGLPIAGIAVVYLAGASIASAAPTPGGIGAVEAALVAGLTALGLASAIAVPAVFLYRLMTFWVPILPGWLGFAALQRRGDI